MAVALAGCGGDSEPATDTARQLPELSIPTERTSPPVTDTTTTPATTPTTVDPGTETLPTEGPTTPTTPETPDDTPTTDTPPPEGSPAQRFEQYCNENPGACG
jgi:hypothetical protein